MTGGEVLDVMAVRASGDPEAAVLRGLAPDGVDDVACDILVVGGGTGGIAAALAAARAGRRVCLLEETDWIGGQLTAQGVSALDEHEHIERFGGTRSYYALREAIRTHYRRLSPTLAAAAHPNPGNCWVTRLAFEPQVALAVLEGMARPFVESGRLRIDRRTKAWSADVAGDRIRTVLAVHLDHRRWTSFRPRIVIDATELGDVLPLVGAEYVVGAESKAETGEPHAQPVEPKTHCVQSFTYTFVLENTGPGHSHVIPRPERYEHYRDTQPYSLRIHVHGGEIYGEETRWLEYQVLDRAPATKGSLWTYRRLIDRQNFPAGPPNDISMINWPGNDYRDERILDRSPVDQAGALQDAKRVSLGFLHWLQTEAPRPGHPPGFPEFKPRPDLFGTDDALGKYPYIRECRRLRSLRPVLEHEVSADDQEGARAEHFSDSVGVGWYPIDIHRAGAEDVGASCRTKPFQLPLGALIPIRIRNLLAGAKNLGTTHITNGCYRLHPVEWNTGEAAGALAAFALDVARDPIEIRADGRLLRDLQRRLVAAGVPLYWFVDVGVDHPVFAALQMAALTGEIDGSPESLEAAALPAAVRRRFGV
ncbi:MAG: FAD-dependent oxidoreductase [Candidatus Rokubacteria bacterium]|nr:FAD-dependent oxidoreductase [Candidatus Rokubacteria bacterium]